MRFGFELYECLLVKITTTQHVSSVCAWMYTVSKNVPLLFIF